MLQDLEQPALFEYKVTAGSLDKLFENAGISLMNVIIDTHHILRKVEHKITLMAPSKESLMSAWLTELIRRLDDEHLLIGEMLVEIIEHDRQDLRLEATVCGENFDIHRHRLRAYVQAVGPETPKITFDSDTEEWTAQVSVEV
ncbi:MAG TPA: archease [Oculatellaceae cyanobacterium]